MKINAKKPNLKKIVGSVKDLPTLPRTFLKITALVNDPKSSAKNLSAVITDDQVLTARLLRLVNSSFYGFPQKIATITNAIVLLGFDAIRNLLLTASIFGLFSQKPKISTIELQKYWDHSLGCAIGSKVIGNYIGYENVEELFVAGLLHDIGKIVEIQFIPDIFEKIASITDEEKVPMVTAEETILGFNHTDIGQLLAERWNLPSKLVNIIALHHTPDQSTLFSKEVAIIHLADILCRGLAMGSGGDDCIPALNPNAWEKIEMKPNGIRMIMEDMEKEFIDLRPLFGH